MKKLFIIGNWKANKNEESTAMWLKELSITPSQIPSDTHVIICPPFHLLEQLKKGIFEKGLPFYMGAQDVSQFPEGAYTGEIAGTQLKEVADFVLIGHSERRKNFGETDEILAQKVQMATQAGVKVIFCVPDAVTAIPDGVTVVAYEPITAIGSGNPDTPENANTVAQAIKARGIYTVIYGGSVTAANVHSFTSQEYIDGVLPGGASLKAQEFSEIIIKA